MVREDDHTRSHNIGLLDGPLARIVSTAFSAVLSIFGIFAPIAAIVYVIKNISWNDVSFHDIFIIPYFLAYVFGLLFAFPLAYAAYYIRTITQKAQSKLADLDSWTGQYLRLLISKNIAGLLIVVVSSEVYREISGDASSYASILIYTFSSLTYLCLSFIRIRKRYFGLNYYEAEELLDFLYGKKAEDDGDKPTRMHVASVSDTILGLTDEAVPASKASSCSPIRSGVEYGLA